MGNITFGFWVGCQFWPTESAGQIEFHCILDNIVEVDFIEGFYRFYNWIL